MSRSYLVTGFALIALWATGAAALTPGEKCEADKLKTAGKYDFCRLKADAKAVKTGNAPDYSKCDDKYGLKWGSAESKAGTGVCPSEGDETTVQAFITQHTDDVAAALAGGALADCPGDLATCSGDLTTCNGNLGTCSGSLTTCNASLGTCTGDLGTCNGDLSTCSSDLTQAQSDLTACNGTLATCSANLSTCNNDYASCSADLATANSGTATAADVLNGKTFSSSSGLGLSGAMPNNGAVSITPGTSVQTIAAGYHNGAGTVAGDVDLAASNIVNGVNIFGVTGTAGIVPAQPLKTGQTTAYGTGSDGDLQKGASRSFTDNGDGTITDNTTGLMWEKKSDDGSIHDKDNTYTWGHDVEPVHDERDDGDDLSGGAERRRWIRRAYGLADSESIRAGEHREPAEREPGGGHGLQHGLRGKLYGDSVQLHAVGLLLVVYYLPGQSALRVVRVLLRRLRVADGKSHNDYVRAVRAGS